MDRRNAIVLAALAVVATACAGPAADRTPNTTRTPAADVNPMGRDRVLEGGELRWPVDQLPANWNQHHLDGAVADGARVVQAVLPSIFGQRSDAGVEPNPDYLVGYQVLSTDPQVVELELNPSAKWSDGRAIGWTDFAAQAKAVSGADPAYRAASTTGYEDIAKVERGRTDQHVVITFGKPFAEWKSLFTPLLPESLTATADAFNTAWADGPDVTGGPFKVGEIDRTAKTVTLVRDESYWGLPPKLDRITFRVVDRSSLADALAGGSIDFYEIGASVDLYERARTTPGVVIRQAVAPSYSQLTFNAGPPTSALHDRRVRLALMRGIDVRLIAKSVHGPMVGGAGPAVGNHFHLPGTLDYVDNSAVASFDPAAAAAELDALGWTRSGEYREKDGRTLAVRYVIPSSATSEQVAKLVKAQLADIGVLVDIEAVATEDFFSGYVNVGDFGLTSFRWLSSAFPISTAKSIYFLDADAVNQNYGRIGSTEINSLLDRAGAELDDGKRAALVNEIDRQVWTLGHQLPLYQSPGAVAVRANLANFGAPGHATRPFNYVDIGFTP